MEQHPIPQNVTAYQFRLVGDMTLKQFLELAGGLLLGFLTTRFTLLPVFFRWPLAGIFAFGGVALAFLPVEERPLDRWLRNFVKGVYSPTQFLWKKMGSLPDFLNYVPGKNATTLPPPVSANDQKRLQSYLQSMQTKPTTSPTLEAIEEKNLARINRVLGAAPAPIPPPLYTQPNLNASLGIKTRKLRTPDQIRRETIIFRQQTQRKQQMLPPETQPSPPPKPVSAAAGAPVVEIVPPPIQPLTVASLYPQVPISASDAAKKRVAPEFAHDLPLPSPPEAPNLLTGMVVTIEDRLIPNTIIEICNSQNQTVRAVKTNKLGQFFIATPLLNDTYEIKIEHPEYTFDIIKFKAEGKIIPPVKIRAKNIQQVQALETKMAPGLS